MCREWRRGSRRRLIGADGTIYAGFAGLGLVALDGATGARRWLFAKPYPPTGTAAVGAAVVGADGTVFLGGTPESYPTGYVYALNPANGQVKWSAPIPRGQGQSLALGSGNTVYSTSVGPGENLAASPMLFALDGASGAVRWTTPRTEFWQQMSSPALAPDGTLFLGSSNRRIYAIDGALGRVRWEFEIPWFADIRSAPAVTADGTVYLGAGNNLFALRATDGRELWRFGTESTADGPPNIGPDGTVYFGDRDYLGVAKAYLYAVCGSSELAAGPWPKFRGDARNTGRIIDADAGQLRLRLVRMTSGACTLAVESPAGRDVELQVSSDLARWQTVRTLRGTGGSREHVEALPAGAAFLFYRLRLP